MVKTRNKYDRFYGSEDSSQTFEEIRLKGWPRNRFEAIVSVPSQGKRILDIGCGEGYLLYQFRDKFQELIGLEYSEARLVRAEANLRAYNFKPILGDAERLENIESTSIDHIISADVIEHIPDVYQATEEMYRVLKVGGLLVINTPNVAFIKKRVSLLLGYFPATSQGNEGLGSSVLFDGGHLHYFTFRSLSLLLQRAGFRIRGRIGYGPWGRLHNFWPPLSSGGIQVIAQK